MAGKEQRKKAAERAQVKPWYRYWKQLTGAVVGALAIVGIAIDQHSETIKKEAERQRQAEKDKYGNLYDMRELIPQGMLEKTDDGNHRFECFLPKLRQANGKFQVNICFTNPPVIKLRLSELPKAYHDDVMHSLSKWNDYFEFKKVEDPQKSDLKIFLDNTVLPRTHLLAISPHYASRNPLFDAYNQELRILDNVILINGGSISHLTFKQSLRANISHEFGHVAGLGHPENVILYSIRTTGGYTSWQAAPKELHARNTLAVEGEFPQLSKFTMMTAAGTLAEKNLREFDRKAVDLEIRLLKQKYGPNYQPPAKSETHEETQIWRNKAAATPKSSIDTLSR